MKRHEHRAAAAEWKYDGLVILTSVKDPYNVLCEQTLWSRQYRNFFEYLIGQEVFVFTNWPLNHKRRISSAIDAQKVDQQVYRASDAESRWLFLADF